MVDLIKRLFITLIKIYQAFLSPLLGPRCRFYPSCSEYTKLCFENFSIPQALWYTTKRILKCNPLFAGGIDPIPKKGISNE